MNGSDGLGARFEGEEPLTPALLGHGDEQVGGVARVVPALEEGMHEHLGEAQYTAHGKGDEGGGDGAADNDDDGGDVEEGHGVAPFHHHPAQNGGKAKHEPDKRCQIHALCSAASVHAVGRGRDTV